MPGCGLGEEQSFYYSLHARSQQVWITKELWKHKTVPLSFGHATRHLLTGFLFNS